MSPKIAESELAAQHYLQQLTKHIKQRGGWYARDDSGALNLILEDRRILLDYSRDNYALAELMIQFCGQTTHSRAVQATIQRLQIEANNNLSSLTMRRFSAMSQDGTRLYIPTNSSELLMISADGILPERNGFNEDSVWIDHPYNAPYEQADPDDGFELFEKLIVETQACVVDETRWLVAMNEVLFCLIRECTPARFILAHIGPSQSGKTTGAQRSTLQHGLGDVKGDFTVAALNNLGDIGLLVMDNKEQTNFTPDFVDYLLFLSTGAERGRSHNDGRMRPKATGRPLGVITTIEGVVKPELQKRIVAVHYEKKGQALGRAAIESEIRKSRHKIFSALLLALHKFFQIRGQSPSPVPVENFEEHFAALCDLLRAYEEVAWKPIGWSEMIIRQWVQAIGEKESDEDDLEYPIIRLIDSYKRRREDCDFTDQEITYQDRQGTLYLTETNRLLAMLHDLNLREARFPQNASGLGRRLRSGKFRSFQFLDGDTEGIPVLKRQSARRPIGFFFAN
ncbi:MAG: hypothetical protein ACRD19_01760 [Terriglobia bacterium]